MNIDRDFATTLAEYARRRRQWDVPGSLAALVRVQGRSVDDVAMAWVRFCADDRARTPGAFPNPNGPHWTERLSPAEAFRPPKREEACATCGRHLGSCQCGHGTHRPDAPAHPEVAAMYAEQIREGWRTRTVGRDEPDPTPEEATR